MKAAKAEPEKSSKTGLETGKEKEKNLSEKEIFIHSLYVAEKEKSIRDYIYVALFYLKYRKKLSSVKHPLINSLLQILKGKIIPGYPGLEEIKEKTEIYNITM